MRRLIMSSALPESTAVLKMIQENVSRIQIRHKEKVEEKEEQFDWKEEQLDWKEESKQWKWRNRGEALQSSEENDTHAQNIAHKLRPNPIIKPKTELEPNDPKVEK